MSFDSSFMTARHLNTTFISCQIMWLKFEHFDLLKYRIQDGRKMQIEEDKKKRRIKFMGRRRVLGINLKLYIEYR